MGLVLHERLRAVERGLGGKNALVKRQNVRAVESPLERLLYAVDKRPDFPCPIIQRTGVFIVGEMKTSHDFVKSMGQ
jgi:hypothetical protein